MRNPATLETMMHIREIIDTLVKKMEESKSNDLKMIIANAIREINSAGLTATKALLWEE